MNRYLEYRLLSLREIGKTLIKLDQVRHLRPLMRYNILIVLNREAACRCAGALIEN
jgi:hypothetical protein